MKTLLSILIIAMVAGCANAQKVKEDKVPAAVVSAFHKMFPDVKDYDWEMEDGNYEAEMENGKMKASVVFDAKGNLISQEKEIPISNLPSGCAAYVSKNYTGEKIKGASEITDVRGTKTFEAEVKNHDLIFDMQGNFVGEEKDAGGDDEDD